MTMHLLQVQDYKNTYHRHIQCKPVLCHISAIRHHLKLLLQLPLPSEGNQIHPFCQAFQTKNKTMFSRSTQMRNTYKVQLLCNTCHNSTWCPAIQFQLFVDKLKPTMTSYDESVLHKLFLTMINPAHPQQKQACYKLGSK